MPETGLVDNSGGRSSSSLLTHKRCVRRGKFWTNGIAGCLNGGERNDGGCSAQRIAPGQFGQEGGVQRLAIAVEDVRQHDGGWILSAGDVRISAAAVISLVVGVLCLRWMIRLLAAGRLHWIAVYCLIAGRLTIAWQSG